MFIGHYAVALGAKRAKPRVSLGILVAAASLLDLIWPILLLLGWERVRIEPGITRASPLDFTHYPITHSLAGAAGWSVLFGLLYWTFTRNRSGAVVVGLVTVSHWFLDLVVHRPDLPLYPGSPLDLGFGLWNSVAGTLVVEYGLFLAGAWLYAAGTRALDRRGRWGFWSFAGFLALVYAANAFGPPPRRVHDIAVAGLALWILPFWAEWFDRRRAPRPPAASVP